MKKLMCAALLVVGSATSANAAVTVSRTPGSATYAGPTPTYTFSVGSIPNFTGGSIETTDTPLDSRPLGSSGNFYSVSDDNSPGTISLAGFGAISSLSFIWGSVDTYNTLSFLNSAGSTIYSITGSQLLGSSAAADGDQEAARTNPVVTFNFTDGDQNVSAMRLTSTGKSFEIDNIAISPVPEPATWGMMMLGLGLAGATLRRRRSSTATLAAA